VQVFLRILIRVRGDAEAQPLRGAEGEARRPSVRMWDERRSPWVGLPP